MTKVEHRVFRRQLNRVKAAFGTATTKTDIPESHRDSCIEIVKEFLDDLDPDNETPE